MKTIICTLATLLLCCSAEVAQAGQKFVKVGNFKIDAANFEDGFVLDDGNLYKPTSHGQKEKTQDWQLGDNILVLNGHHSNRFLLINTRTNQKVKAKVISFSSSD